MRHRVVNTMLNKLDLPPCTLGEGPVWRKESQEFIFTDIVNGTLYAAAQDGTVRILLQCRYQLGAFLLDAAGDLLLLTEAGVFACPYSGGEENFRLIWQIPMLPGERFNDAICDPVGRVLAGTKTEQDRNGSLWQFAPGQPPRRLLGGLKISNGMGFSGQGRIFYHTDSPDRTISQYDYDVETGRLSHGRALVKTDGGCVPDGMTVDKDGFLWTACWGGGRVERSFAGLPGQQPDLWRGGAGHAAGHLGGYRRLRRPGRRSLDAEARSPGRGRVPRGPGMLIIF